jgi:hypothetical protein
MKSCSTCKEILSLDLFFKDKTKKSGRGSCCKRCSIKRLAEWEKANKDKVSERHAKRYLRDRDKILKRCKDYYLRNKKEHYKRTRQYALNNPEVIKQCRKRNRPNNRSLDRHHHNLRRARKLQATPAWADLQALKDVYKNTPKGKVVDHIIPMNSELVSGLHVPWNLQYLTLSENSSKRNRFDSTYNNESWRKRMYDNKST